MKNKNKPHFSIGKKKTKNADKKVSVWTHHAKLMEPDIHLNKKNERFKNTSLHT